MSMKSVGMFFDVLPYYITWFILSIVFLREDVKIMFNKFYIEKESEITSVHGMYRNGSSRGIHYDELRRS
jgi:hypothetical protein